MLSGILAALLHRKQGGGGQTVEVPMFETSIAFNLVEHFGPAAFDPPLGSTGLPGRTAMCHVVGLLGVSMRRSAFGQKISPQGSVLSALPSIFSPAPPND